MNWQAIGTKAGAGALSGLMAAVLVDYHAFSTWKSFNDAKNYNWGVALFRWVQGAVSGALVAIGYGAVTA